MLRPYALVFDLGNVFVDYVVGGEDDLLYAKCGRKVPEVSETDLWRSYERGEVGTQDFFASFKKQYGYSGDFRDFCADFCDRYRFALNREMYELLLEIKLLVEGDTLLWLLSNLNPLHFGHIHDRWPGIFSNFYRAFLSYELGLRKPDPEIFRKMLDLATLKSAYNCLFVDDKAENCAAAKKLGFITHQFEGIGGLKKFLAPYGIHV